MSKAAPRVIASMFAVTHRCGSMTPFGSAVLPLVNCRIASESGSTVGASKSRGVASELVEPGGVRAPAARSRRAGGRPARSSASALWIRRRVASTNSSIEPSRIGSGSIATVAPREPGRLDRGHERTRRRAEQAHRDARSGPAGLERRGHRPGVVVEAGPGDRLGRVGGTVGGTGDEGDAAGPVRGRFEPRGEGRCTIHGACSDSPMGAEVTWRRPEPVGSSGVRPWRAARRGWRRRGPPASRRRGRRR